MTQVRESSLTPSQLSVTRRTRPHREPPRRQTRERAVPPDHPAPRILECVSLGAAPPMACAVAVHPATLLRLARQSATISTQGGKGHREEPRLSTQLLLRKPLLLLTEFLPFVLQRVVVNGDILRTIARHISETRDISGIHSVKDLQGVRDRRVC